jgi:hypothetical protein
MNEKELNEIKNIVDALDKKVDKEGAVVQFGCYGASDESVIQANQKGYFRLGIEFLKAAFAPETNKDSKYKRIDMDIDYLTSKKSMFHFIGFERRDDIPSPPKYYKASFKEGVAGIIFAIVLIAIVILAIMGIISLF